MTAKIIGKKVIMQSSVIIEGERCVDSIVFTLPEYYGSVKLSDMECFANLLRPDGSTDKIPLAYEVADGEMTVSWQIGASVTSVAGDALCHLSFENSEGTVVFMTERFTLSVKQAFNAYEDYTERVPSALYQLRSQMAAYVSRMQELIDEVDAKIDGFEGGSGSGGGQVYDQNNKLPAAYVDGLATVATSGDYSDLTGSPEIPAMPDMSAYATVEKAAELDGEATAKLSPLYLKYISFDDDNSTILSLMSENSEVMKEYCKTGVYARPLILWDEGGKYYYNSTHVYDTGAQIDVFFKKGSGVYSITYNRQNNTFGFSE